MVLSVFSDWAKQTFLDNNGTNSRIITLWILGYKRAVLRFYFQGASLLKCSLSLRSTWMQHWFRDGVCPGLLLKTCTQRWHTRKSDLEADVTKFLCTGWTFCQKNTVNDCVPHFDNVSIKPLAAMFSKTKHDNNKLEDPQKVWNEVKCSDDPLDYYSIISSFIVCMQRCSVWWQTTWQSCTSKCKWPVHYNMTEA